MSAPPRSVGSRRPFVRLALAFATVSLGAGSVGPAADAARTVSNAREFHAAVAAYRSTGGTIVMRRGVYARPLVVGPRGAARLRIEARPDVRIHLLTLDHTRAVTVRGATFRPVRGSGGILAARSSDIVLSDLVFTAAGTRHRVSLDLERSTRVPRAQEPLLALWRRLARLEHVPATRASRRT